MLKRIVIAFLGGLVWCNTYAQQASSDDFKINLYGFVRADYYADTYKGLDVGYEDFYVVPNYAGKDANGEDINEQTSANLTAMASRLGVKIQGPELLNAKTNAVMEFDFLGITKTEPTLFRIRHAYFTLNWEKSKLMAGQTWHPFWGGGAYPMVASLNTGCPFQPFSRTPQIRYDYKLGKLTVGAAAVAENQYTSKAFESGKFSTPNQAKRNALFPELALLAEYNSENVVIGGGAEVRQIKPRMTTEVKVGDVINVYKANEYLTSTAFTGYVKYSKNKLFSLAKVLYGQNMTHLTTLSGYAVVTRDAQTGAETYTNYNTVTSLVSLVYGKEWQVGCFGGYLKNLGTSDAVYLDNSGKPVITGLLPNVQDAVRGAVSLAWNVQKLRFAAEYEMTSANYGIDGFNPNDGTYADTHRATNNRLYLSMVYAF